MSMSFTSVPSCSLRWRLITLSIGVCALAVAVLAAVLILRPWSLDHAPRYRNAAVATNGHECAEIGKAILEKHGSAADAAIAALFCEGVACPQSMGIGGGFLLTYYKRSTRTVYSLNARESAPAATTRDMFDNQSSTEGGAAAAVPGELRGYAELHKKFGVLPWADLVRPTAELCRNGHLVTDYLARVLSNYKERIMREPSLSEVFIDPNTNDIYKEGDLIKRPKLATTLDIIASEGPDALNNGSLTEAFVNDVRSFGGIISVEDMMNYRAEWQEPIEVTLTDEIKMYTAPLPGSGCVLTFILQTLIGWLNNVSDGLRWHRTVETFKYAYAHRTGLGDPNRPDLEYKINSIAENLTRTEYAVYHRSLIDDNHTSNDYTHYGGYFDIVEDYGTAQISVVAPNGDAVSVTSTINYILGAMRRSPSTGIILNNEMDDFAIPGKTNSYGLPPSPANYLEPNLKPLSSMSPTILIDSDGEARLVIGAAGGTKITTQVAIVILGMIEGGSLLKVANSPRLHHQLLPMEIQHEAEFNENVLKVLREKGHETSQLAPTAGFAALIAIAKDLDNYLVATTDTRRPGSIAGF